MEWKRIEKSWLVAVPHAGHSLPPTSLGVALTVSKIRSEKQKSWKLKTSCHELSVWNGAMSQNILRHMSGDGCQSEDQLVRPVDQRISFKATSSRRKILWFKNGTLELIEISPTFGNISQDWFDDRLKKGL